MLSKLGRVFINQIEEYFPHLCEEKRGPRIQVLLHHKIRHLEEGQVSWIGDDSRIEFENILEAGPLIYLINSSHLKHRRVEFIESNHKRRTLAAGVETAVFYSRKLYHFHEFNVLLIRRENLIHKWLSAEISLEPIEITVTIVEWRVVNILNEAILKGLVFLIARITCLLSYFLSNISDVSIEEDEIWDCSLVSLAGIIEEKLRGVMKHRLIEIL